MSRLCGNWISAYLEYTRHSESPLAFHFWTAVGTIAGALRRRVWIDQHYFQWTPNFYIVFVAPPGIAAKSTSLNIGLNLLRQVDGVKFGPQSITWQALTQSLAESRELVYLVDDPNIHTDEAYPMSCITCSVGELGTFLNPADKEMIDVLTSLWDGQLGVWTRKTKTQGEDVIVNPWINILGATTPAWIRSHFTEDMILGGLASRTLFVYADQKRHLTAYPGSSIDSEVFEAEGAKLVEDLRAIANIRGEYELTPAAREWGERWYAEHWGARPTHMASERFGGYLARKQTHLHKCAIVFAAADNSDLLITDTHLRMAEREITRLEVSMHRVFDRVGESMTNRQITIICNVLRAYGEIDRGRLWKNCITQMSGYEFKRAIDDAVAAGIIKIKGESGGRLLIRLSGETQA